MNILRNFQDTPFQQKEGFEPPDAITKTGVSPRDEPPLETKDGSGIDVEFISNVYSVGNKKIIQCNIRNITGRKTIQDALQVSETRYRRLFETAQDGILILDEEPGEIIDVNHSFLTDPEIMQSFIGF